MQISFFYSQTAPRTSTYIDQSPTLDGNASYQWTTLVPHHLQWTILQGFQWLIMLLHRWPHPSLFLQHRCLKARVSYQVTPRYCWRKKSPFVAPLSLCFHVGYLSSCFSDIFISRTNILLSIFMMLDNLHELINFAKYNVL